MSLNQFMVFAAVAKHRSISRAAKELDISQPSVTQQLKLLENNYNVKLHKRSGRGIELTEAGRVFLRGANAMLKQHETLKQTLNTSFPATNMADSFTVGGSYGPSVSILSSLLATLKKRHPQMQLTLRTDNWPNIENLVLKSEVDIAVVNNPRPSRQLTLEAYREEPFEAFVAIDHPLAGKRKLTSLDVERTPCVVRRMAKGIPGMAEKFLNGLKKHGLNFNIALRCDSPDAVKMAVKNKAGMGFLLRYTMEDDVKRGDFKIIKVPGFSLVGKSYIVYRKDRPLTANAQEFLALLRQWRRKSP